MLPRTFLYCGIRHRPPSTFLGISPVSLFRVPLGLSKASYSRGFRTNSRRNAPPGGFKFDARVTRDIFNVEKWSTEAKIVIAVLGGCSAYYIYHLERVPVTGRLRFMDVSPESERFLGEQNFQKMVEAFQDKILSPDHILSLHVQRVVSRILQGSRLGQVERVHTVGREGGSIEGAPGDIWSDEVVASDQSLGGFPNVPLQRFWKVLVINDDNIINAFATNGAVIIFSGILPLCMDENGLAAVVGHEIAHTLARHPAERVSSVKLVALLGFVLDYAFSIDGLIYDFVMNLPNYRVQELEADRIGLILTAQACYDPQVVPIIQNRLALLESRHPKVIEFLQTHPSSERRAKILESYLPDAYSLQAASSFCAGMGTQLSAFGDSLGSMLGSSSSIPSDE